MGVSPEDVVLNIRFSTKQPSAPSSPPRPAGAPAATTQMPAPQPAVVQQQPPPPPPPTPAAQGAAAIAPTETPAMAAVMAPAAAVDTAGQQVPPPSAQPQRREPPPERAAAQVDDRSRATKQVIEAGLAAGKNPAQILGEVERAVGKLSGADKAAIRAALARQWAARKAADVTSGADLP